MFRWIVGGAVVLVVGMASGCGVERAPRMTIAPTFSLPREEAAIGVIESKGSVAAADNPRHGQR